MVKFLLNNDISLIEKNQGSSNVLHIIAENDNLNNLKMIVEEFQNNPSLVVKNVKLYDYVECQNNDENQTSCGC